MPTIFPELHRASRLLMEAELKPVQGERFQPTGFADLGPARYQLPDENRTEMLLVESAQSIANRLEAACWDEVEGDLVTGLKGLPYVKINLGELGTTTTIQEFHRLNSPYIWIGEIDDRGRRFRQDLMERIGIRTTPGKKTKRGDEDSTEDGIEVPGS